MPRRPRCLECRESPTGVCRRHRPPEDPSLYPPDWPKCHCGEPALDGHLTCGRLECDEAQARRDGQRIDQYVRVPGVGVKLDMGWAIGVLNADETFTRTCKGCGITVTTPVNAAGDVSPAPIRHKDHCPVLARLGNNPALS